MNQQQWISRGRELVKQRGNSDWILGDWLVEGEQYFGTKTDSYDAAQKATGISRGILYRHAMLARHYAPALRFSSIPFFSYYQLKPFPIEFTSRFLPTVADKSLTCGQILTRAVAEFGSDPAPRRHHKPAKFHPVRVYAGLYNALAERAQAQQQSAPAFIQQILEEFLVGSPVERQPMSNLRTNAWREKVRNAGVIDQAGAIGDTEDAGNSPDDAQPRPTYAERRAEKFAAKEAAAKQRRETAAANKARREAEKLAAKQRRLAKLKKLSSKGKLSKIKLQWTPCHGSSYVDGKELLPVAKSLRATLFASEVEANAANEQFARYYGYTEAVVYCDVCAAWHLKHVYASQVAPEIDLSAAQKEVRATVNDFIQQNGVTVR